MNGTSEIRTDQELELVDVNWRSVEFRFHDADGAYFRHVTVLVGGGTLDRRSLKFPHGLSEAGESTGDDEVDARILRRAREELTRLACAVAAIEEHRAA